MKSTVTLQSLCSVWGFVLPIIVNVKPSTLANLATKIHGIDASLNLSSYLQNQIWHQIPPHFQVQRAVWVSFLTQNTEHSGILKAELGNDKNNPKYKSITEYTAQIIYLSLVWY